MPLSSPPWRPVFGQKQFDTGKALIQRFRRFLEEEKHAGAGCRVLSEMLDWLEPDFKAAFEAKDERELTTLVNTMKAVDYHLPASLHWFKWQKEAKDDYAVEADQVRAAKTWMEIPTKTDRPPPHPRQKRRTELFA